MKFFKKGLVLSLLLIALVITLTSCSGKKKVSLSAEKTEISVIIGEDVELKLSATEVKKFTEEDILSNLDITSSDQNVVKVENNSLTAVGIGTANVTATWKEYEGATVTVKVNVLAPEVGEVTYSELPANIYVGDIFSITHQAGSDVTVTYTTSNSEVLSVDGNQFEAKAKGTAKITATATNGYKEAKQEWTVEVQQGEYTITYVLNGGTNSSKNPAKYDVRELPLALAAATKANKTFLGWSTEEGSTDYVTEISAGSKGDIILYANFADIVRTISYELDGGTLGTNSPETYIQGEETELVNPTKEGYTFLGWSTTQGSTTYITSIAPSIKADVKLYANWEKIPVYSNIVYVLNDGVLADNAPSKYEEGKDLTLPVPTKDGFKFLGWTKEEVSSEYVTSIPADTTGDFKVYAQWKKQTIKHSISYELNGGVNAADVAVEFEEGVVYTLPTPTKDGFRFLGWTKEENSSVYVTEIGATEKEDVTLYAKWLEVVEGAVYVGAGLDYATLDEAIAGVAEGAIIILAPGEYSLSAIIDKSVEIVGPNADLAVSDFGKDVAIINVTKDKTGNVAAKKVVFNGVTLLGNGTTGGYFTDGGNVEELTFKSCTISTMNTFIRFNADGTTSNAVLTIENSHISSIGQFALWTTSGLSKTILIGNYVNAVGSGTVTNENAALFRVRGGSFEAYDNYFAGDSLNAPGYFESIAADSYVKYNTFENVTKYVFTTAENKLVFDENLYLDVKGKVLTEVPSQVSGTGITADATIATSEDDRINRYMKYLTTTQPERYFLITFDAAEGEIISTYPFAYDKEVGVESLPLVSRDGYLFSGWYLNGELVESIPAGTTGTLTLVAKWREPFLIVDGTNEVGHFETLAAALEAALEGDIIKLVAGNYSESVTIAKANLTIQGPNVGVAGNANRAAEAVVTGVFTVNASAKNLKIDGIKFTGDARIVGTTGDYSGFIFQHNLVADSKLVPATYAASTNYLDSGFINFAYSAVNSASNFAFNYNKFENVPSENIHLCRNINLTVEGNEFINFTRDAVRIDGGYVSGVLSFTNNKFENPVVGTGQNGVYFKSYSGQGGTSTNIIFKGNEFIKCGGLDKAQPNSGAIGAWSYQENGGNIVIEGNIFDHCYNNIYFRNNGCTVDSWSCYINNNIFLGLPTDFYYQSYNGSSDTQSSNPHITEFGANYYEDNSGNVITDLGAYATYFKHCKGTGTALAAKPKLEEVDPLVFYFVEYVLDGGTYNAPNLVMAGYELTLGTPVRQGWTFLGWSFKPNSTDYVEVISATNKEDLVLYANWQRINSFVVTYDLDGGVSTESYLKAATPAATLEVNNYNYNEGAFWSGTNYTNNVFLGQASCDPAATFSDRIYIGKDEVTGLWVVLDIIQSGPSSWAKGAEYVLTISNSHNNKATLHAIVVNSIKVGQVVAFSCDPLDMNHTTPGSVHFYDEAPTESKITLDVTTNDTLITPSKLGSRFEGWYDAEGNKYETVFDLTTDVELKAKWFELTPVTDMQVDEMTEEMVTGDTFQIVASVRPTDAYFQNVLFETSDPDIVSVTATGLMTANNAGTCTVTIRDYMGYAIKTYTVVVYSIASIDVEFEDEFDGILSVNEKVQIHAHSLGKDIESAIISYASSDSTIATVDADGYVTALKEGVVTITVTDNTGSNYQVKIQLIVANLSVETKVDQVLKLIADYNFAIVDAGNVCLYNDGTQRYYDSMYGSVNYFLFTPYVVDEQYYANSDATTGESNHKERRAEDSIEFVTVHDTATLTGTVHSIASSMSTGGTSIHYTTGNGEILGVVREKYRAYHAGDGTGYSFSWLETGVAVSENAPEFDMIQKGDKWFLTINGQETSIELPVSNGSKTIANPSKAHFTTLGPSWDVKDGKYVVAPFRVDFSQVAAGSIGNYGGNNNSVGIEMCVNVSSDVYDTWQRTGQLVADICLRNGLGLDRVKEHNTWSGKNCPQSIRAGQYWDEFMKMVEVNYIMMKDYADAEITFKSNNPDIVNEIGRVVNPPKTTTTVSYDVTVTVGGVSKTITLYSVIPGTTSWTQWDGSYSSKLIWNEGNFGKVF